MSLHHLAFLSPGTWPEGDAADGLEATLRLFRFAEDLGYDSAWVRQRHLERSVSSAATLLAAASQRTERIGLGAAVIQMGYQNPWRLAEDLATVDTLSRGRLQVGLSGGPAPLAALMGERFTDGVPAVDRPAEPPYQRLARLRDNLQGDWLADEQTFIESAGGRVRPRLQPPAPGLVDRLWVGAGSLGSARWAGEQGFNLLIGNISRGELSDSFHAAQQQQLDRFHTAWRTARPGGRSPRVALGRVILPTDSADAATRRRYREFAASRLERTRVPQGERRTLYAPDLVGSSDQILSQLHDDPVLAQVLELRLELPYHFTLAEHQQILADTLRFIAPALGWRPAGQPLHHAAEPVVA